MSTGQERPCKRRRATKACDFCHRRGRKCQPKDSNPTECLTCASHGVSCTWNRVAAKRGAKPRIQTLRMQSSPQMLDESRHGNQTVIQVLIDIFFSDIYPIICTVHEPSFRAQWYQNRTLAAQMRQPSYARLLAICALSAQRINSGASPTPVVFGKMAAQTYFEDALSAINGVFRDMDDIENLQAVHLLCVTAMEMGQVSLYHQLMGLYHSIVANEGLAEEERWPSEISVIEREERRRLLWHMYRLEVHTSLILGHVIRLSEAELAVAYPQEHAFDANVEHTEWLTGWNFVTDLYRGMEHLLVHFRSCRRPRRRMMLPGAFLADSARTLLLQRLKEEYESLPDRFRQAPEMSSDVSRNRCVYQTANIICTHQLLKMLSYASGTVTVGDACQTVLELVEGISAIPVEFLRSMSLAMVQELSGFGHLLSNFIGKDITRDDYKEISKVMACMTDLLECLVSSIPAAAEAAMKLKTYVDRIQKHLAATEGVVIIEQLQVSSAFTALFGNPFPFDFGDQGHWFGSMSHTGESPLLDQLYPSFFVA